MKNYGDLAQWLLVFRWVGSVVPLAVTHVGSSRVTESALGALDAVQLARRQAFAERRDARQVVQRRLAPE
jgi:hypothetical protein